MIHANAIHSDQSRTRSQARQPALGRHAPSITHHQFQRVSPPSRQLGRARLGRFFFRGLDELHISALCRAGVSEAVAAALAADQCAHQPAVQAFADVAPVVHLSTSSEGLSPGSSPDASKIAQKRGQGRGFLSQEVEDFGQGGGAHV